MKRIPFIFGKVVSGDDFLNREEETASLTQALVSGQNIICYSPRRYGKTSMMMQVKKNLENKGALVFFIDLYRVTSLQDLYNIYATSIITTIQSPITALVKTLQTLLPTINPRIVFAGPGTPSVEISVPIPVLIKSETLHELFSSLEKYCEKKKKKGVVIFDEFQEATSIKDGELIEREMRSSFQHHKHVSYAFLGSKQNLLKNIFKDKSRPFYNFGRHFDLDVISTEHWKKFIQKNMGRMCSAEIVNEIVARTENHPFYTQMYCHYLWVYAKQNNVKLNESILDAVLNEILGRDSGMMAQLWERITIIERHLLKAIAGDTPTNIYEKEYLLMHDLGSASSVQKAFKKLLDLEYLRKLPTGIIAFVNPLFKHWIVREII